MRSLIASVFVSIAVVAFFSSPVSLLHASRLPQERNLRGAGGEPKGGFVEERVGFDISGPYQVDPNWPKKTWPAPGYIWGSQAGVYPESADKVFLVSRGEIELPKDLKIPPGFLGDWGALNRGGATGEVPLFATPSSSSTGKAISSNRGSSGITSSREAVDRTKSTSSPTTLNGTSGSSTT